MVRINCICVIILLASCGPTRVTCDSGTPIDVAWDSVAPGFRVFPLPIITKEGNPFVCIVSAKKLHIYSCHTSQLMFNVDLPFSGTEVDNVMFPRNFDFNCGHIYIICRSYNPWKFNLFRVSTSGSIVFDVDLAPFVGEEFNANIGGSDIVCDYNGDGFQDVAVGFPGIELTDSGKVVIFSGNDGHVLNNIVGPGNSGYNFGLSFKSVGRDTDNAQFIVGGLSGPSLESPGYSRYNLFLYRNFNNIAKPRVFSIQLIDFTNEVIISGDFDFDSDGVPDVLAGLPRQKYPFNLYNCSVSGFAVVLSGKNGATLMPINNIYRAENFGHVISPIGDWNGDGAIDFTIGYVDSGGARLGIFSGGNGQLLSSIGPIGGDVRYCLLAGIRLSESSFHSFWLKADDAAEKPFIVRAKVYCPKT